VHNWREFLKEYAIIVLGVATALAAEQGVEWLHWHARVAEARTVIGDELGRTEAQGIERVRDEFCIERRLDVLASILDQASRTGVLPPVPQIGQPHSRAWPDAVRQTVVASQTATHFPPGQLNALGRAYSQVRDLGADNQQELLAWATLSTMIGPGRGLDPASNSALRSALSHARYYNRIMALAGGQLARAIGKIGLAHSAVTQAVIDRALKDRMLSPMCQPMDDQIPSVSGQAPLSNLGFTFRDWQNYPPYAPGSPTQQ
jgi:hypothetical protein